MTSGIEASEKVCAFFSSRFYRRCYGFLMQMCLHVPFKTKRTYKDLLQTYSYSATTMVQKLSYSQDMSFVVTAESSP